ncbi:GNAT family N-acetyltransferase [Silvimonas iriomotensis]|uniref:N-acetyltransferase GCN5 n=1 Tax=Silvimonas iriomotensis TaxID=449662 RepID=A0ABQ2P631_9NEIS|nr:GNAT family N-acetyltransferase [Silvimonas iriomotensis]GGP18957.1 N-acetyltransferase GCN5 [Silvimonas iriomotensis]
MSTPTRISRITEFSSIILEELSEVLVACVEAGASVSFMSPFSTARAAAFWQAMAADVASGKRLFLVAQDENNQVVGTVHAILNLPDNQPHRAEVAKLLVHPRARKQGIAAALMQALEQHCAQAGKTLLVLDTVTGGAAERLYTREGWQECGKIPGFALMPDGQLCGTTVFYKQISPG